MTKFRIFLFLFYLGGTAYTSAQDTAVHVVQEEPKLSKAEKALKELILEKDTLAAQNALSDEQFKHKYRKLAEEKQGLQLQRDLADQKLKNELAALATEKQKLELENALQNERNKQAIATLKAENEQLEQEAVKAQKKLKLETEQLSVEKEKLALDNALKAERLKSELASLHNEKELLVLENAKAAELARKKEIEFKGEKDSIMIEMTRLDKEMKLLQMQKTEYDTTLARLETDLKHREGEHQWDAEVNTDMEYHPEPFQDGILTISDRRIALNGVIINGVADYVTKRIHYFNNKSPELPIFIVMDRCPGGSVMEGYRILKAMEASKAPIHVLVKSYAASMAAFIATMAEQSYALPNSIILHHQPFGVSFGNLTQQQEQMDSLHEWARRLHTPVAERMGITLEKFYEKMYEKHSEGDWREFSDDAVKYKWVKHVIDGVREEGIDKLPTDKAPVWQWLVVSKNGETEAPQGKSIRLPRLEPFDCYFIHNPEGVYHWE